MSTNKIPADELGFVELLLRCDCYDLEHMASISYFNDENQAYISLTLDTYKPWYSRIWTALKHVFGARNKRVFNEVVLTRKDIGNVILFLNEALTIIPK